MLFGKCGTSIFKKMDKPLNISTIETIRRRGYRFCYPTADAEAKAKAEAEQS